MISAKGGEVKIVLGIDRLDYTKGLTNRLLAFERLLDKYPAHIGKVMLLQASFPYKYTHFDQIPDLNSLKNAS